MIHTQAVYNSVDKVEKTSLIRYPHVDRFTSGYELLQTASVLWIVNRDPSPFPR